MIFGSLACPRDRQTHGPADASTEKRQCGRLRRLNHTGMLYLALHFSGRVSVVGPCVNILAALTRPQPVNRLPEVFERSPLGPEIQTPNLEEF